MQGFTAGLDETRPHPPGFFMLGAFTVLEVASFPAWAWPLVGAGLSGRRIAAMVVNDYACELDERGALESIASRLAPTVSAWARSLVGAGLPAMVVNDNAGDLDKRGALESIASRLAPTVVARDCVKNRLLPCPRHAALVTFINPFGEPRGGQFARDFRALQHDPRQHFTG